ncbi:hypothetical protein [Endozoicomonas euniceicola]|uniref:Uncharacterized protein n=1 Tax=Endozoicomonas euniceicola TaxID=1234143 RepID=A0ABY6H284_9GAMM|nr:hypothetical protein [Endozoicomonas euniceicola]UYM18356.1 hypothetical protein NX720_10755 [Endozoicomonas euniceicola]
MIYKILRGKFCFFKSPVLLFFFLLLHRHAFAENSLFGIPYTMPGQKVAIMLYAATQPEKNRGKDLVLISESAGTGFGIYAFLFRFQEVINEDRKKPIPFKRIMLGITEEADTVKRIFQFPADSNDLLLFMDEDLEESPLNEEKASRWIQNSRQTIALVNDVMGDLVPDGKRFRVPYSFFETLHHTENLTDIFDLDKEYQSLTRKLLSTETLNLEKSFKNLSLEYVKEMIEYAKDISEKEVNTYTPLQANLAREFGLRSHKIGLLLNKPGERSDYLKQLDLLSEAEIYALTGQDNRKKSLSFFQSGDYYYSYMHTLFANLQFIQTISLASNKKKLTLVMKMKAEDFNDSVVIDALRKVNITRVNFWSNQSAGLTFDLRPTRQDKHGIQINVVNLFPTPELLAQSLAYFSQPVVGTTGELSLFRAISMGKLPLHEWMILQRYLNDEFARIAKDNNQKIMYDYFHYFSPEEKANALRQLLKDPSIIKAFINTLTTQYNASPVLKGLIEQTIDDNSQLWQAISKIDKAIEEESVQQLPEEWQDIALLRQINIWFQALSISYGTDDINEATKEIRSYSDKIQTPLLKEMFSEIHNKLGTQ